MRECSVMCEQFFCEAIDLVFSFVVLSYKSTGNLSVTALFNAPVLNDGSLDDLSSDIQYSPNRPCSCLPFPANSDTVSHPVIE